MSVILLFRLLFFSFLILLLVLTEPAKKFRHCADKPLLIHYKFGYTCQPVITGMIASSGRMKRVRKKSHSGKSPTGQVRIIGGQWRGRKLPVFDAQGLRPTTDRNKETLFNWLMHHTTDARCLDVFAGSGGLGIEALSRYAGYCVFFEKDKAAARQLEGNLSTLNANGKVVQGDALTLLGQQSDIFDIVFIDPPFHKGLVEPTISLIQQHDLVQTGSLIYLEQEPDAVLPELPSLWQIIKHKQSSGLQYLLIEVLAA